jgi:Flp pilus assembly pilin Flp
LTSVVVQVVLLAALCSLAIVVSGTTVQTSYGPVSGTLQEWCQGAWGVKPPAFLTAL